MSRRSRLCDRDSHRVDTCYATCLDCDWKQYRRRDLDGLQRSARTHVHDHHHHVEVHSTRIAAYRPRTPETTPTTP